MDFDSFFRNKVESMLITASWVEQVQKILSLTGVSQVWGERPQWYVWIEGAPGVYALVFETGNFTNAAGQSLYQGQFAVKCYPFASAVVFDTFSPAERKMVGGDVFDHTHTPRLEARRKVPEAFFTIGSVSFVVDAAETVALFTFDSLNYLRWSVLTAKNHLKLNPAEKSCIRNIPGWQVGYPLFDRIISLYAFYSKQAPAFIGATRAPGFECAIDFHQTPENRQCDDIQQWSASVLFDRTSDNSRWIDSLWRTQLETEEKIVFQHVCSQNSCHHAANHQLPPIVINPLWWELARANIKSSLATTCGCCDHAHQPCDTR
ncbi:MAG: hypothetical protein R3274_11355 [Desulfobacterales bacterium]|nr:hypothetical protein [Desulfobacterales bacterium]